MATKFFKVGTTYLFRTVSFFLIGKVEAQDETFLRFKTALLVADTGRYINTIAKGELSEIESINARTFLNIESIVDATEWKHPIPKKQK